MARVSYSIEKQHAAKQKKPPEPKERETKKNRKMKMETTRAEKNRNKDWTEYDSGKEARLWLPVTRIAHKKTLMPR